MFKQLKIVHKIYLLGTVLVSTLLVVASLSVISLYSIGDKLTAIAKTDIPLNQQLSHIEIYLLKYTLANEHLIDGSITKAGITNAKSDIKKIENKLEKELLAAQTITKEALVTQDNRILLQLSNKLNTARQHLDKLFSTSEILFSSVLANDETKQKQALAMLIEQEEKLVDLIDRELENIESLTLNATIEAKNLEEEALRNIVILAIISIVIGITLPHYIAKLITAPLKEFSDRMQEIAEGDGDLTIQLDDTRNDEIGQVAHYFNRFMNMLSTLIKHTNSNADELGVSSENSLKVMRETLNSVESQRTETEQVASAVSQMTSTTDEVAKTTSIASQITENVKEKVLKGQEIAENTKKIVEQLSKDVSESTDVIHILVSETGKIEGVLSTIQGIAEQTNLLALNAAIEAARAGESGRGFAVVADEVRSLAKRTQVSTIDIQDLINSLQKEAKNAIASMEKGTSSATTCLQRAAETSETFASAAGAVNEISDLNLQIATASEEQSAVATEINSALININEIAKKTTEGTKEATRSNDSMAKNLISLHGQLNQFQV